MKRWDKRQKRKATLAVALSFGLLTIAVATIAIVAALSQDYSNVQAPGIQVAAGNTVQMIDDSVAGFGKKKVDFYSSDEHNADLLLRIAYAETWKDDETGEIKSNTVNGVDVVTKEWTYDFYNYFVDGGDGWYYYKKVLKPLDRIRVMSSITLAIPSYQYYSYDLSFRFEAIVATPSTASRLWGYLPSIISRDVVVWDF